MTEESRSVRDLHPQELELIRLGYVVGEYETLADVAKDKQVSYHALKRLSASEGWAEHRAGFRAEAAQNSHFDTGVHAAETHALLMQAMRDQARFAAEAAANAAASGDTDDFDTALRAIEQVNKLLGAVKGTIGPSASGLAVTGPVAGGNHSGGGHPSLGGGQGNDDEALPSNVIKNTRTLIAQTVATMTEQWSTSKQREADARQAADAAEQGLNVNGSVVGAPGASPTGPPPPGPAQVVVTQTPPAPPGPPTT